MNDEEARPGLPIAAASLAEKDSARAGHKPTACELIATPGAFLCRGNLRELGLERRAVDAVFRALPIVALPGYSRPLVRVADYLQLVEESTYRGDRVRAA